MPIDVITARRFPSFLVKFTFFSAFFSTAVWGHGYLASPRSRNFVAYEDGKWWPLSNDLPAIEDCPHCLNRGGTIARCGMTSGRNYDAPKNGYGGQLQVMIQDQYTEGQDVVLDVILTAHHKGHFTYKACPVLSSDQVPTQSCFDENPLNFVEDLLYDAQPDPSFPERAYIAPSDVPNAVYDSVGMYGMKFSHKYHLPVGLTGDLVLIQWHYITANSCKHSGYDEYNFPQYWNVIHDTSSCGIIPEDGNGVPEQFWNCAEVSIALSDESPNPTPPPVNETPRPTPSPVSTTPNPTPSPVNTTPNPTPSMPPNQAIMKCGRSWVDASSKCGTLCPTGNATECPTGELCYADVPDNCIATKMTCGKTWLDASSKCGTPCPMGNSTNCPMGELCYDDVPDYCSSQLHSHKNDMWPVNTYITCQCSCETYPVIT
uniref:Chitin-binding type-4 domain-containing protein n=2 Tax=Ditylum brightwellii TaxID=49249 RepID=A0A7S4RCF2_9STRA